MTQFGDLAAASLAYQLLSGAAITTNITSTYVDMGLGGGGQFGTTIIMNKGLVSGTSPTLDVKLIECDTTDGTYSDVTGATFAQQTTSGTNGNAPLMTTVFVRSKRYVKAQATVTGTNPSFAHAIVVVEQKRKY